MKTRSCWMQLCLRFNRKNNKLTSRCIRPLTVFHFTTINPNRPSRVCDIYTPAVELYVRHHSRTLCLDYSRKSQKNQPRQAFVHFRRHSRIRLERGDLLARSLLFCPSRSFRQHRHLAPGMTAPLFGMSQERQSSGFMFWRFVSVHTRQFISRAFAHSRRRWAWTWLMVRWLKILRS